MDKTLAPALLCKESNLSFKLTVTEPEPYGCSIALESCGASGGSDLPHTKPQLSVLRDNGGPTRTLALCTGAGSAPSCHGVSPAIDAGDDAACPATDQRGFSRPAGAACDIGAYEVQ